MGRPTKLTPEIQEKVLSAIRAGSHARVAAGYAGVSRSTFARWLEKGRVASRGIYRELFEGYCQVES